VQPDLYGEIGRVCVIPMPFPKTDPVPGPAPATNQGLIRKKACFAENTVLKLARGSVEASVLVSCRGCRPEENPG
jgi:hypothetical protein